MHFYKINFWFTSRVFFYNCCFSFLSLAKGDPYSTVFVLLTGGFIVGIIVQKNIHKSEEYVFQNLGISNLQRYSFAFLLHIVFALFALLFIWLVLNYV